MKTKVPTRRERQEQTRELLLDAAAMVFARRGYHEASVEEIASEAGFSTGAVYSNFSGKEELFLALADREVEKQVADPAIDHRADLYSFGCVAYELLAGEPPFAGLTRMALLRAHIVDVPPAIV